MTDPDLRDAFHRVADSTSPLPVGDDLWQRGVAARRRRQAFAVAAVLALVVSVGGVATLVTSTDREARTASSEVPEGAIPSRIEDPSGLTARDDLAVGRGSVAFVDGDTDVVVVSAADGRYHALALPGAPVLGPVRLSLDGEHLAYGYRTRAGVPDGETEAGTAILDLRTGDVDNVPSVTFNNSPVRVSGIGWSADSAYVAWSGKGVLDWTDTGVRTEPGGGMLGIIDVATGSQSTMEASEGAVSADEDAVATVITRGSVSTFFSVASGGKKVPLGEELLAIGSGDRASTSPRGELTAVGDASSASVPFVNEEGDVLSRALDPDLYPSGAQVMPLGWTTDHLLLAQVDAPAGSYVEGRHLALFTSPDRPKSGWTYRIVMRDIAGVADLSVAVDLIPDLDGTSSQQLTYDFGDVLAPDQRDISWIIGLGVAAAIAVLLRLRWLWRRFT